MGQYWSVSELLSVTVCLLVELFINSSKKEPNMTESIRRPTESARLLEGTERKCKLLDKELKALGEALATKKSEMNTLQSQYDQKKVDRDQAYAELQYAQR